MGTNKEGAKKAIKKVRELYGQNAYKEWGSKGGKKSAKKGFAWLKENDPVAYEKILSKANKNRWPKSVDNND